MKKKTNNNYWGDKYLEHDFIYKQSLHVGTVLLSQLQDAKPKIGKNSQGTDEQMTTYCPREQTVLETADNANFRQINIVRHR